MKFLQRSLIASIFLFSLTCGAQAQEVTQERIQKIETCVNELTVSIHDRAESGIVLILFGAFCALWAQNTNRNPWLWFFLGFLFSVITILFLLAKNAQDKKSPPSILA